MYIYFEDVARLLGKFDYVIGNLETPFTQKNSSMVCKSAHIKTDYSDVDLLKHLNIGIVNPHIMQGVEMYERLCTG